MPIVKESSDELNPPVLTQGVSITPSTQKRTPGDYVALAIATCGVGLIPLAPGTWGSAVGVFIYVAIGWLADFTFGNQDIYLNRPPTLTSAMTTALLFVIIMVTCAGTWAATRAEKLLGRKDPGAVVVDEVAGQLIAFLFVPLHAGWWAIGAAFVLFRLFDIWKPYPIRRLESLGGGLGIMADDVLAGIYAAIVMSVLISIYLLA